MRGGPLRGRYYSENVKVGSGKFTSRFTLVDTAGNSKFEMWDTALRIGLGTADLGLSDLDNIISKWIRAPWGVAEWMEAKQKEAIFGQKCIYSSFGDGGETLGNRGVITFGVDYGQWGYLQGFFRPSAFTTKWRLQLRTWPSASPFACVTCALSNLPWQHLNNWTEGAEAWFSATFQQIGNANGSCFLMISWALWGNKNRRRMKGVVQDPQGVVWDALCLLQQYVDT
ncbi:hypothetical protein Salat_1423300 [Sesamum alatum]|uniref:Uncharacterized protein n=1 Tax=Sesamum alatum TaxID=300844 RepID=A0AAE1YAH9_9LAMI|nr:hypothetical protein Salat_1423300 [Sesamum alatum]